MTYELLTTPRTNNGREMAIEDVPLAIKTVQCHVIQNAAPVDVQTSSTVCGSEFENSFVLLGVETWLVLCTIR